MREISEELMAHLKGDATRCAELVRVMRRDGEIVGITSHDRDIFYAGVLYRAGGGFTGGALRSGASLKAKAYEIEGVLESEALERGDLEAGLYDHARVDVYLCNWSDLSQGVVHLRRGWIGDVHFSDGSFRADLRGFQDLLERKVCETYTPECRFDLGDGRCGVDLEALAVSGSVTGALDERDFYDYTRSEEDGTFQDARLVWLSGRNKGVGAEVRLYSGAEKRFSLWVAMGNPIEVGDRYSVTPGCDKRFATCKARFGNGRNYGGFPHLPGIARLLDYPEARS